MYYYGGYQGYGGYPGVQGNNCCNNGGYGTGYGAAIILVLFIRSEERRVGKEC